MRELRPDNDCRINHVLVVLGHLKVGEGRGAAGGVGHHPEAPVDHALVVHLLEDPPDGLHEPGVHGLVVVFKIDPPEKSTKAF